MKLSQFNSFQPFQDKILAYNSFSNKYLVLEHLLYDLVEAAKKNNNYEEIQAVHPLFYQALCRDGFLVENDVDEINKVRVLMDEIDGRDNIYRLIINPTMNCNFKCWYCYETHIKDSKMEEDMVERTCKFIRNVLEGNANLKVFALSFFGGEPLLYYQKVVIPILEYACRVTQEYGVQFTSDFTTNGFLINPEMTSEFKRLNVNSFQITLDGNQQHHDTVRFVSKTRGSYFEIVRNIILLAQSHFRVTLRINYTQDNLDKIEDILHDISCLSEEDRKFVVLSPHKVWQDENRDLGPKVKEFMKLVKLLGFATTHSVMSDSVRYSCYADKKNQATINYNGEVFKCTARDFTSDNKEGILTQDGKIEWNQKYHTRLSAKLKNPPCLECSILPICGGGCSQKAMENENKEYCVNFFDENKKKDIVMDRFLSVLEDAQVANA